METVRRNALGYFLLLISYLLPIKRYEAVMAVVVAG